MGERGVPGLAVRRRPAHARRPPLPAPAHVRPRNGSWRSASAPREVNLCWCGSSFVASLGLGSLCKLVLSPAALQEAAETKMSGKLETSEHHRTVPLAS